MASLFDIRRALATAFGRIDGLRTFDVEPAQAHPPCLVVSSLSGTTTLTFTGPLMHFVAECVLLVGAGRLEAAERALDEYLAGAGPKSLNGALDADPQLGGLVGMANLNGFKDAGILDRGGVEYIGAVVTVDIYAE